MWDVVGWRRKLASPFDGCLLSNLVVPSIVTCGHSRMSYTRARTLCKSVLRCTPPLHAIWFRHWFALPQMPETQFAYILSRENRPSLTLTRMQIWFPERQIILFFSSWRYTQPLLPQMRKISLPKRIYTRDLWSKPTAQVQPSHTFNCRR